ncbi:MAG: hypothetical protein H6721_02805 [Sandaracinus sp.]|nr:hypothetical protein [Sandaracinus sp.]
MRRFVFPAALALLGLACSDSSPPEPAPAFEVSWLTPTGALPADVASVRLVRVFASGTELELFQRTRTGIDDEGGILAVRDLPTEEDLDLELQGYDAGCTPFVTGCRPIYLGRATARLRVGERRYVRIAMYQVSASDSLDRGTPLPGRFLHTATALDDGRVLIAGGFTSVSATTCPDDVTATHCFEATASDEAYVFDPATALFHPVQGGLAGARGGHTATRLADGRVVVAGGATQALIAVVDVGSPVSAREILVLPRSDGGDDTSRADAEIFEPNANPEEGEDVDRDGDPARGGFGDPVTGDEVSIPLNDGRFLHAAAIDPTHPSRVLLAGGVSSPATYEIFDGDKPGGPGVYDNGGATLSVGRVAPGAVALGSGSNARIWIVGGAANVASNDGLADVWTPDDDDPLGSVTSATDASLSLAFPAPVAATTEEHPEYALIRPAVAALDDGDYALVTGWYGPRCPSGMTNAAPIFSGPSICDHRGGLDRTFTVRNDGGATTRTIPPSSARHGLTSAVTLRDGRVMIIGGVENGSFTTIRATVVYDRVDGNRAAGSGSASLSTGRIFHAAAEIFDSGVVVTGGISFDATGATATLVRNHEAVLLAPLDRGRAEPTPMADGGT